MRSVLSCSIFLVVSIAVTSSAQQPEPDSPTITLRSNLVEVPALVSTRKGEVVFSLQASAFSLIDNGVPQQVSLLPSEDQRPLAAVVIVECGAAGGRRLGDYRNLAPMLDAFVGGGDHKVALVTFDSLPHLVTPFTTDTDLIADELNHLHAGDNGAAILDALVFGVQLLRDERPRYRRAILLLSETVDRGSSTTRTQALRLISSSNAIVYSFAFPSTAAAVKHEASKLNRPDQPGPTRGCFSHNHSGDPTDAEYDGHYSSQVLDCISDLAPPLRLATMAFLAVHDSLRTKTAESIARLSGGEFHGFHNAAELKHDLIRASHDRPNFYALSFRPTDPAPGMHALGVSIKDRPDLQVQARTAYWIEDNPNK